MRIFQNLCLYPSYLPHLRSVTNGARTFSELMSKYLDDRNDATHILLPVYTGEERIFFTNGDTELFQRLWAVEHGMPNHVELPDILLAQLEEHRSEVFYNMDPITYDSAFVRRLPACVKVKVAWRAAPRAGADFSAYDLMVSNLSSLLASYARQGLATAFLTPSHDPVMDEYSANLDRPVDVTFVGVFSRHHMRRAKLLEAVAGLRGKINIAMFLDRSRATKAAESLVGRLLPLGRYRRPRNVRRISKPPVFGRDMYAAFGRSKIVINASIDMAGADRGNMRCWEALGLGTLMISDDGIYPAGMVAGKSFLAYTNVAEVPDLIIRALGDWAAYSRIAKEGNLSIRSHYSKQKQQAAFEAAVSAHS